MNLITRISFFGTASILQTAGFARIRKYHPAPRSLSKPQSYAFPALFSALLLGAIFCISSGTVHGQSIPLIRGKSITLNGNQLTIVVTDTGSGATTYSLESNDDLVGMWDPVTAAPSVSGDQITFTITRPGNTKFFYRVVGESGLPGPVIIPGIDDDGDGLTNAFEAIVAQNATTSYSDSMLFDTDMDGFSDGIEFSYGTMARDGNSKPVFSNLPTVNFVDADAIVKEGDGSYLAQIVFDRSFNGTVKYTINPMGNTTAGVDYAAVSGLVSVNGTTASIPITMIDNATVSGQRVVIIDLTTNGDDYFIGGRGTHVILLEDNDAWWSGALYPVSGEVRAGIFRLKIVCDGGTVSAEFGAGAGNDGFSIPVVNTAVGAPPIGSTSISSAIIPVGTWPATGIASSTSLFHAESPLIQLPTVAGSLYTQVLKRKLTLNVNTALNTPANPHLIETVPYRYVGDYGESLHNAAGTQLAAFAGTFILERDLPAPLPVLSPLVPSAP